MITNPLVKRILVYGDSLPWGLVPGSKTFERYPADVRWPGQLQNLLGDDFEIIEENLCARTLDSDDPRPGFEGRNGLAYLISTLDSHDPLDAIVISLGLNEIKSIYPWTPAQVGDKLKNMLETVKSRTPNFHAVSPRLIILTQPIVREGTGYWGDLWAGSHDKSVQLAEEYRRVATELNVEIIDVTAAVETGVDGVHLAPEGHKVIAEKLAEVLK